MSRNTHDAPSEGARETACSSLLLRIVFPLLDKLAKLTGSQSRELRYVEPLTQRLCHGLIVRAVVLRDPRDVRRLYQGIAQTTMTGRSVG